MLHVFALAYGWGGEQVQQLGLGECAHLASCIAQDFGPEGELGEALKSAMERAKNSLWT